MKHYCYKKTLIEINENCNEILDLYANNIDDVISLPNRLILLKNRVFHCIFTIDNSNIFFKIKFKKMEIIIKEQTEESPAIVYDTELEFESQPDLVKDTIKGLHNLAEKTDIEYDFKDRVIKEVSEHETFKITCEYGYLTESYETRFELPRLTYKVEEI